MCLKLQCHPRFPKGTGFKMFDLNKSFREGSLGFSKPPDTASSFVRIHQVFQVKEWDTWNTDKTLHVL